MHHPFVAVTVLAMCLTNSAVILYQWMTHQSPAPSNWKWLRFLSICILMSLLSCPRAQQLYRTEMLHSPGRVMTVALLRKRYKRYLFFSLCLLHRDFVLSTMNFNKCIWRNRMFIAMFTRTCHLCLSWLRRVQSKPYNFLPLKYILGSIVWKNVEVCK